MNFVKRNDFNGSSKLGDVPAERVACLPQIRFRALQFVDRQDLVQLHQQCFPVNYESQFYDKSVDGRLWSCAAVTPADDAAMPHSPRPNASYLSQFCATSMPSTNGSLGCWSPTGGLAREQLAAVIISQISPQEEFEDVVLEDRDPSHQVAYICTLGVFPAFRKHGLASRLLDALIKHVESEQSVKALVLHVLTTNEVALRFYELNGFQRLKLLPNFYTIGGRPCDAYLYARHFHGGKPVATVLQRVLAVLRAPLDVLCTRMLCQLRSLSLLRWAASPFGGGGNGGLDSDDDDDRHPCLPSSAASSSALSSPGGGGSSSVGGIALASMVGQGHTAWPAARKSR